MRTARPASLVAPLVDLTDRRQELLCGCIQTPDGLIFFRVCDPCWIRMAKELERQVQGETWKPRMAA